MQLVYADAGETSIEATLDEKETLGGVTGPAVVLVPVDPANAEYADIVANGYKIEPYVPPEPEPVSLPNVMPVDANDATPKAYVDQAIAQAIAPLRERIGALEKRGV